MSERAAYASETARVFGWYGPLLREGLILGERDAVSLGRPAEAAAVLRRALDLNEELARKDPADSVSRGRVGTSARELGDILRDRDPRRALDVYELGIRREGQVPASMAALRERAELLAKSSYPLRRLHRASEAEARIDAALAILREIKDYPAARIQLGGPVYSVVRAEADHLSDSGKPGPALEIYRELLYKASDADASASLQDAARVSQVLEAMAVLNRRVGQTDAAAQLASRRLELWQSWDQNLPNNSYIHRQVEAARRPVSSSIEP
jgi:tetratricopeptide (TPR) repeat protein